MTRAHAGVSKGAPLPRPLRFALFAVLRVGGRDGGGARLRGGRVRNRGCQRDHQGGAAARPPHRPTPALSRRPLTSGAGDRDRADAVHVPAHQSAAVDQQRAASPVMTLPPCQQLLPHGQFLHGQPLRSQPSVPARPSPGAPLPEQPQQPRSDPRSFLPQLAAQLAAPLDPRPPVRR